MARSSNLRFSLAVENEISSGYTTEKITEAFFAGTVPLYMGDPLVHTVFNHESFLNLNGLTGEQAADRIMALERNEGGYIKALNQPVFVDDQIPRFARPEYIMGFFERIFDH